MLERMSTRIHRHASSLTHCSAELHPAWSRVAPANRQNPSNPMQSDSWRRHQQRSLQAASGAQEPTPQRNTSCSASAASAAADEDVRCVVLAVLRAAHPAAARLHSCCLQAARQDSCAPRCCAVCQSRPQRSAMAQQEAPWHSPVQAARRRCAQPSARRCNPCPAGCSHLCRGWCWMRGRA